MTPPPDDAVAALLAELQESPLPGARYAYTVVKRHAAGWTLSRRSDLEAATAAEARVAVLVEALERLHGAVAGVGSADGAAPTGWHQSCTPDACYVLAALVAGEGEG